MFTLLQQQRIRSCDVCVFLALIYVKAWFSSSQSIEAAQNDIQLIKNGILYSKIDSVSSEIILDKISNHLLYLGSETIGMSFFDVRVSVEEKRKMVAALNIQKKYCHRIVVTPTEIKKSFAPKNLSDFVSSCTQDFFKRFNICTDFLKTDPTSWENNEHYLQGANICRNIKVVNDISERFVQLFTDYNLILTKDESQKQYLLQVVRDYTNNFPSVNKKQLA